MAIELPMVEMGMEIGKIYLEDKKVIPNDGNSIHFTCSSRADCCSTMQIPVSPYDIERIEAKGYALDQIIKENSPMIFHTNSLQGRQQKAYIIKKKPFDGTCTFLQDNLCSVHQFKPFACRIYPFALDFISDHVVRVVIHQDQLCKSIKAVDVDQSNNTQILEGILQVIMDELEDRGYEI